MDTNSQTNPQINAVLQQLERFGFKYFGVGENNEPLVIAPNGQVIPLKVAYEFVQFQIKKSSEEKTGGNAESMPSMSQSIDTYTPDISLEKSPEKETAIDQSTKNETSVAKSTPSHTQGISTSVKTDIKIKMPPPFDDGFKITKFDPTDLEQVEDYVNSNKSASNTSSTKWLAAQFEKFLKEYKQKNS